MTSWIVQFSASARSVAGPREAVAPLSTDEYDLILKIGLSLATFPRISPPVISLESLC